MVEKDQKSKNYKEEMQVTIKADIIEDYDKLHRLFYFSICCYCFTGHRIMQCDLIMRWCCSNLGQGLLQA